MALPYMADGRYNHTYTSDSFRNLTPPQQNNTTAYQIDPATNRQSAIDTKGYF